MKGKKAKKTGIGGQAVLEGVMMRGKSSMAIAVRDEDGIIRLESKRLRYGNVRKTVTKIPVVRGVVNFIDSFINGIIILTRSAEVYGEGEPSKFEKWCADKLKINVMNVIVTFAMILGLALAVALFILLPTYARQGLELIFDHTFSVVAKNFIEGGFKILIFVLYILLVSLMKDIRRTFEYHGAEHKTISCYESGLELTPENAKKCTRVHNRCGTTFMVFVMVISILTFAAVEAIFGYYEIFLDNRLIRTLLKIALLPLVAGLSYELLKGLAKTDFFLFYPLKIPGLLLQRLTTREPDLSEIEVAIAAFNEVMLMDEDENRSERSFLLPKDRAEVFLDVKNRLKDNGIEEEAEAEWIVSLSLGIKRSELSEKGIVRPKQIEDINRIVEERIGGRPLWYCIGNADFYGYKINVNESVLIPRPETEELVEEGLKYVKEGTKVLDLCTGSGAIAIAVKKKSNAVVYASDVSEQAIKVAKINAEENNADITFFTGDMFDPLLGLSFDVIFCNPPYIKTGDLESLQEEVKREPTLALDGGDDGLNYYRIIEEKAKDYIRDNGVILMECGFDQAEDIKKIFKNYKSVSVIKDLSGIERIIKVEK